jgi:uncharacterized membrane protein HdeD (DUF308 family)
LNKAQLTQPSFSSWLKEPCVAAFPLASSVQLKDLPMQRSVDPTISSALSRAIHDHWRVFLAEGIILVLLGLAALVVPFIAGLAVTVTLGWLFLFAGIVGLIATFRTRGAPGFAWSLISALVAIVAGAILLWNPLQGLVTLTYVLIAFFIVDGLVTIFYAIAHRQELSGRWEWMLVNGIIDLILAAIIISGLPGALAWALGLLVGIDMVFGGVALIAMALTARTESDLSAAT